VLKYSNVSSVAIDFLKQVESAVGIDFLILSELG
jgi:hypothetical protein